MLTVLPCQRRDEVVRHALNQIQESAQKLAENGTFSVSASSSFNLVEKMDEAQSAVRNLSIPRLDAVQKNLSNWADNQHAEVIVRPMPNSNRSLFPPS